MINRILAKAETERDEQNLNSNGICQLSVHCKLKRVQVQQLVFSELETVYGFVPSNGCREELNLTCQSNADDVTESFTNSLSDCVVFCILEHPVYSDWLSFCYLIFSFHLWHENNLMLESLIWCLTPGADTALVIASTNQSRDFV